eukprot:superscaffoldBa00000113_g1656
MIRDLSLLVRVETGTMGVVSFGSYHGDDVPVTAIYGCPDSHHPLRGKWLGEPSGLVTDWQGRVPLRCTLAKDKASKQNQLHCNKRRNFREQGINADPSEKREAQGD